jgi:hypothetical protein
MKKITGGTPMPQVAFDDLGDFPYLRPLSQNLELAHVNYV